MFRSLLNRRQAAIPLPTIFAASLTAAATIAILGLLSDISTLPLLIPAFGASCVLVFTIPTSPLSSPINVISGHVLSALCGLLMRVLLPTAWWSLALGVGLALAVMAVLRVTHPPAGGTPIAIMVAQDTWLYLIVPVLAGAIVVSLGGSIYRVVRSRIDAIRAPTRLVTPTDPRPAQSQADVKA